MVRPCLEAWHVSCDLLVVDVVVFSDVLSDYEGAVSEVGALACCVGYVCFELSVQAFFKNLPINCI